jgi:predicted NBD/HSP70 family sugar kinase
MKELGIPRYASDRAGDGNLSKLVNRAAILKLLRKGGGSSRASLAKESGLTKVTVSSQVAELIELGIVREAGAGASELGRKPVMLEVDGSAGRALGVSISTEGIRAVSMDPNGAIERDESLPLGDSSPEGVISATVEAVRRAKRRAARSRYGLFGVGIAVPGAVEPRTGRVLRSAKLDWTNVPLKEAVAERFDGLLHVGNDATLATFAERELYAPGSDDFVCLLIDEGIGSGAFINGEPHYGHNGRFGEVGHMTIVHDGPRCPCGNLGCWDLYGSELALRQALAAARGGAPVGAEELLALTASPPDWSRGAFSDFVAYLITGVVSIVNSMAPSTIAVNSAVLAASPSMFDALKAGVADRTIAHASGCELRLSSLGKAAPAVGAAMAASERFFEAIALRGSKWVS